MYKEKDCLNRARARIGREETMVNSHNCSWCGKSGDDVKRLFPGPLIFVCNECVDDMSGAVKKEDADLAEQVREEIDRAVQESFRSLVNQIHLGPLQDKYQRLMRVKFDEETGSPTFMEVFDEFKKGVEAEVAGGDYQTRYDLGIAYHEMGLVEDSFREMVSSLKGALTQQEFGRASETISALLYMHEDSARAIAGIYKAMSDAGVELPKTE